MTHSLLEYFGAGLLILVLLSLVGSLLCGLIKEISAMKKEDQKILCQVPIILIIGILICIFVGWATFEIGVWK